MSINKIISACIFGSLSAYLLLKYYDKRRNKKGLKIDINLINKIKKKILEDSENNPVTPSCIKDKTCDDTYYEVNCKIIYLENGLHKLRHFTSYNKHKLYYYDYYEQKLINQGCIYYKYLTLTNMDILNIMIKKKKNCKLLENSTSISKSLQLLYMLID